MPFFENPMKMTISSSDYTPFPVNFWEFRNLLVWNTESILYFLRTKFLLYTVNVRV